MGKTLLPPGFRFHPTDIELVKYYLKRKVMGKKLCLDAISEVDIYKHSPWDLPDKSYLRTGDLKWYFFCPVEKKYGKGARCNRATECGYWKATGKDRPILYNQVVAGMIKTLVFHKGKAPKGERTDWVMHEYRLEDEDLAKGGVIQDMYVLCVLFQKDGPGPRNGAQYGAPFKEMDWSDDEDSCDISVSLNSLSTPTFADPLGPSCSVATTSCAPKNLSYTPTSVDPNGSVATTSCAPYNLPYTPTSLDPIDQVGSTSSFPENLLSTPASAGPIKQVGSLAATEFFPENLYSVNPSASMVSPGAPPATNDTPVPNETCQILSDDDIQAMLEMFSEDISWEEMFPGPTNHSEAIPSSMPSHGNHNNSLATGSCLGVANSPVSSSTHVSLPAALNMPPMAHGAPSSLVGGDDIESLLAIFTDDNVPYRI